MDHEIENKQASPVNPDESRALSSRHIQVNLSKEYFASLLNQEDSASSVTDGGKEESSHNERLDDVELGVTPFMHDVSPIKGIIKHNSELHAHNRDSILSGNSESPQSQRSTPSSTRSTKSPKSPKKVRINEPYHDKQFSSAHTIAEMEGLRTQLRHMIQLTQLQNSSKDSQHEIKKSLVFENDVAADDVNMSTLKSRKLFEDGAPFRGMMSYTSPPLEMDENGIMHGTETGHLSGMEKAAYVYTSPPTDRSLIFENSLLKENLEKEKERRKHCEDQVQNLQRKILEMQQQLAVAVATDRKKAIMIEQLDKTLANIVAGWKKQDSEKGQLNQKLREENRSLRKSQNKQQELLGQFEKELAHAVESLTKEQSKTKAAEQDKEDQLKRHEEQRKEAYKKFQEEKEISGCLREDIERFELENTELIKQLKDLEDGIEEERSAWRDVRNELSEEMAIEKSQLREEIEKLQQSLMGSQNETQDAKMRANDLESEVQNVRIELDTVVREKETLKVETALLEAKIETLKAKQESETRALLEEEFNKRINAIQDEIMRTESQLKETHKEQILELNQRHKEDLELQLKRFHEELNKREIQSRKIIEDSELKLSEAHNEILELRSSKAKLESQRKELTRRLQTLMQQHIQEAVSLLSTENGSHATKLISPQIAEALSHQVQNPPDDESVISDVQKDNFRDHNPFSSTFTDVHDYLSTTKSSLANSRSSQQPSVMISSAWNTGAVRTDKASKKEPYAVPVSASRTDESGSDIWSRPRRSHDSDRYLPLYGQETWDPQLSTHRSNDSMLLREQRLQAGLQDLSDKLRQNDLYSSETPQISVDEKRQESRKHEEEAPQKSQWEEIQQLLRSKLDEVKEFGLRVKDEDEDSIKQQVVSRQGIDHIGRLDEETVDADERDIALTSLIKKLLKMSPGNPVDDDNDYEEDLLEQPAAYHKLNSEGTRDVTVPVVSRNLDYLPVGSDSVSKDSIEGNLKTPPRPNRSSFAPAFKKSVLRERPLNSSYGQQIEQEEKIIPARKSPRKALESQLDSTDDARKQLLSLMRALGIEDDGAVKNADKQSSREPSQSQDKRRPRGSAVQSNAKKSSRSSGSNLSGKIQQHPKMKQKLQDELLSRLQKVYGNPERQPMDVHTSDQQGKAHVSRQVSISRGASSHTAKQIRLKEQRKIQSNAKPAITAWK